MLTDKRVTALIISFAMLASTFSMGVAFADENTDASGETVSTEAVEAEDVFEEIGAEDPAAGEDPADVIEEEDGVTADEPEAAEDDVITEETPGTAEEELQPEPAEEESSEVSALARTDQTIRVVIALNSTKRVLLKPDAYGTYTLYSSISKIRNSRNIRILISNPAACPVSYSGQKVTSNTNGQFLEPSLIGCTVNNAKKIGIVKAAVEAAGEEMEEIVEEPGEEGEGEGGSENGEGGDPAGEDPDDPGTGGDDPGTGGDDPVIDPNAIQVTEIAVRVNGTGEAYINFKAQGSERFLPDSGKIIIRQTRPTSVMNRTAKVRTKTGNPKTIPRKYKEKYFKIVKDGDNEKAVYKYRTVTRAFEIKRASGISESGYRANQGGGTDGTYCYNALCKKGSKTYVKIVKTRLRDMKVVKVSKDLKLNHANDITYDPVHKRLVVTHNDVKRKRVTFVNPRTLKSMGYKDIKIPKTLKGATKSQMSKVKGFASVTYMTGGKYAGNYIGVISGNHNFLVLDKNFKPIEYITVDKKFNGAQVYYQGADNIGSKLYVAVYPKSKSRRDFIVAYDMDGNFQGKVNLLKGYETENIFHAGNKQYMTLYRMVTKVWYTAEKVEKKVKLTKKERAKAKPDKKGKKPKYKTVIKIVKVKHTKQVKRSFIFRMNQVTL